MRVSHDLYVNRARFLPMRVHKFNSANPQTCPAVPSSQCPGVCQHRQLTPRAILSPLEDDGKLINGMQCPR